MCFHVVRKSVNRVKTILSTNMLLIIFLNIVLRKVCILCKKVCIYNSKCIELSFNITTNFGIWIHTLYNNTMYKGLTHSHLFNKCAKLYITNLAHLYHHLQCLFGLWCVATIFIIIKFFDFRTKLRKIWRVKTQQDMTFHTRDDIFVFVR